jgi:hypothetical protein
MKSQGLWETIKMLYADSKYLYVMDESNPACSGRFASLGISQVEDAQRVCVPQ